MSDKTFLCYKVHMDRGGNQQVCGFQMVTKDVSKKLKVLWEYSVHSFQSNTLLGELLKC